jgi:hypothetical protein
LLWLTKIGHRRNGKTPFGQISHHFNYFHHQISNVIESGATAARNIQPVPKVKPHGRIMVWGMMSNQALSELHFVPQKVMVTGDYYRETILDGP